MARAKQRKTSAKTKGGRGRGRPKSSPTSAEPLRGVQAGRGGKVGGKARASQGSKAGASNSGNSSQGVSPKKPPKFSWVEEGLLAGQGRPTLHNHVQYLVENGFKYIITLTLNKPRSLQEFPGEGLTWVHIPIQDETPPSLQQMEEFVSTVETAKTEKVAVSVHCAWGRGRTGTMLACYLAKSLKLSAGGAIEKIRTMRPGSIDTEKQINAVKEYATSLGQ